MQYYTAQYNAIWYNAVPYNATHSLVAHSMKVQPWDWWPYLPKMPQCVYVSFELLHIMLSVTAISPSVMESVLWSFVRCI